MAKIAFIGLGNMGTPMARSLLGAEHELVVFDLVPEARQKLADAGASTPLGSMVRSLYAMHCANGNGRRDFSSTIQLLQGGRLD